MTKKSTSIFRAVLAVTMAITLGVGVGAIAVPGAGAEQRPSYRNPISASFADPRFTL